MKPILASLVVAFLALALAGCVQTVQPQQLAQIRTIAIVTGFGERIEMSFVGLTVFTNRRDDAAVDWNIDGHFKQRAAAELGSRYRIQEVAYEPRNLRQPRQEVFGADPAIALVQSVVPSGGVDALLYFGPAEFEDTLGRSSQYVGGLGLYGRSSFGFGQRQNVVFAAYRAVLLDGKTLQPIAQANALLPTSFNLLSGFGSRIPNTPTSIEVPDRYESLTAEQKAILRRHMFDLVNRTMPELLGDIGLR